MNSPKPHGGGLADWILAPSGAADSGLFPVLSIDPVAAIWLGSLFFFLTGFLAGVFTLYFWTRFERKGRR